MYEKAKFKKGDTVYYTSEGLLENSKELYAKGVVDSPETLDENVILYQIDGGKGGGWTPNSVFGTEEEAKKSGILIATMLKMRYKEQYESKVSKIDTILQENS